VAAVLANRVVSVVYRILFYQLLLIAGGLLSVFLLQGIPRGLSALAGSLAYGLPTFIFARCLATCAGARFAARFMLVFLMGEAVKLILSGVLFLLAVNYCRLDPLYAIIGLVGAIMTFWVASVASLYHRSEVNS
jgi:ATP synthase protein I